ncbi:hypothetical protein GCM10027568_21580 [Humibacter soli]
MRERKSSEILAAARELFLRDGFGATSIDAIASTAGVSKATVYSNFADKNALLVALLAAVTAEATVILRRTTAGLEGDGDLRARFIAVGTALVNGVLRPEVLSLRRLAIAQASAFPTAVTEYWRNGPASTVELLTAHLERMRDSGELVVPETREAATQFAYALVGPLQDRALLAPDEPAPTATAIHSHVESTVDAFLRANARGAADRH